MVPVARHQEIGTACGEMVIFENNRLTIGTYSNAIQNFRALLLTEFRHTTPKTNTFQWHQRHYLKDTGAVNVTDFFPRYRRRCRGVLSRLV